MFQDTIHKFRGSVILRCNEEHILSYFTLPLDNGSVEGLNDKAKVVSHKAYGFRSVKTYILKKSCLSKITSALTI